MATLIDRVGPCTITVHTLQPFEALTQSIVYQQLNGRAAETILGRVLALYAPKRFPAPADFLRTDDTALRAAGLSRAKAAAVKSLAQHSLDGTVPTRAQAQRLGNEALIERLTRVRGIGRWTVEMFLIFGLSRPDVWPVLDFGVRKGLGRAFGKRLLPTPRQAIPYGRKFSPYSSLAAWYCWRAADIPGEAPSRKTATAKNRSR
jgi:3-methyladenine DNA glycosylase/8-oxoguanine DNA glycosylase